MYLVGTRPTIYLIKSTIKHKTTVLLLLYIYRTYLEEESKMDLYWFGKKYIAVRITNKETYEYTR